MKRSIDFKGKLIAPVLPLPHPVCHFCFFKQLWVLDPGLVFLPFAQRFLIA
jgi:hypothetical protein